MIGRRGLLGLLAGLPFVGSAVAALPPSRLTLWVRTLNRRQLAIPCEWERERFATFEAHCENYKTGWGQPVEWAVTDSPEVRPTKWNPPVGVPSYAQGGLVRGPGLYAGNTDPMVMHGEIGDMYINTSNRDTFHRTRDGWQFAGRI